MRLILSFIAFGILFNHIGPKNLTKTALTPLWDTVRPLANPDKGWYHHLLDNGVGKYLIQDEKDLTSFPGMDHLYLRLCWAYLEPEEGKFNWAVIDTIINKYVPMGYGISFRISCKETGAAPASVPVEIDGIRYATPYWVKQAGAKGIDRPEFGSPCWSPDWNDPVFIEKLTNFHKAFAKKYDGKAFVRYMDVGSIGDWGEGHTHSSTRIPPTVEEVKTHMDIYRKCYKKTQLVVTDDLLYWNKKKDEVQQLYDYAISKGFTLRDDSPLVQYYIQSYLKTWTVSHPHFYDPLYLKSPVIFELEHYGKVKGNGYWIGKNGAATIPTVGYSGAELFLKAMETEHSTYIGFHGYLGEWLKDNPDLTVQLLNKCGYWYFPKSIQVTGTTHKSINFEIEWLNKGVAPAYKAYQLRGKLVPDDNRGKTIEFIIDDSGNQNWLPDKASLQSYNAKLPKALSGSYTLKLQLFDKDSGRAVDIGLKENERDSGGYYSFIKLNL